MAPLLYGTDVWYGQWPRTALWMLRLPVAALLPARLPRPGRRAERLGAPRRREGVSLPGRVVRAAGRVAAGAVVVGPVVVVASGRYGDRHRPPEPPSTSPHAPEPG